VNLIIEAFARLANNYDDWYLVIVGEGPDKQELMALSKSLGLETRVIFQGHHPNPQQLLQQAAIFVNFPDAEPFGLAVAEARASGCAIVVADIGGMPEVVDYGRAGTVLSEVDPESIARSLDGLMAHPNRLTERRRSAQTDLDRFTAVRMATNYDAVYTEALSRVARR